jgi:hypothetical protein
MTAEYLAAKKVPQLPAPLIMGIATASATQTVGAAVPQLTNPHISPADLAKSACVVTPYDPNMPADGYMAQAFGLANPHTGKTFPGITGMKLNISFSRQDMEEIVNAREAWGCFDTQFVTQVNQAKDFGQIMALHHREVFKDLGGLMQAVKDGAGTDAIAKFADFRETVAAVTATPRGQLFTATDLPFYGSVIYDTGPALRELKTRIDAMGVDKFRQLSGDDMLKLANDITTKNSLSEADATHRIGFNMLGAGYFRSLELAKADPAAVEAAEQSVAASLERQDSAVKRSLSPMSEEDMKKYIVPLLTPQAAYEYLQSEIFSDKAVQKNPDDVTARLRVHRDLMDKTRDLMDKHPDQESIIRQVLRGIFLSNPMMEKAPPPKPAPVKGMLEA